MRIVIDATRSSCALPLFGMTLLERVLRTVLEAGLTPSGVRIQCTERVASESWLPTDLGTRLPLRFEEAMGTLAEALVRAASDSAVLAVGGDAVLDPRLRAYAAGHSGTAARARDAAEERLFWGSYKGSTDFFTVYVYPPFWYLARTFISRRNSNLPLFNVGVIVGLAIPAFCVIVAWQVAALRFHAARVVSLWMTPAAPRSSCMRV